MSISERVFKIVDESREEIIDLERELIVIPSMTGSEGEIAEFVAKKLREIGLEVKLAEAERGRPNVIGRLRGSVGRPVLILNSHMDTVTPGDVKDWRVDPFSAEVKDGKIYGLGACDNKGALTAMIMTTHVLQKAGVKLKGNLILTAVVDEELGGHKGTEYLVDQGLAKGDMAIACGVSDNLEKIYIAGKGCIRIEISTKGKSAHSSTPKRGINAIEKMAKLILESKNIKLKYKPHKLLGGPTIAPATTITGGTRVNVIPALCKATWDIRFVPGQTREDILDAIEEMIKRLQMKDKDLKAKMRVIGITEPAEISEDEEIVKIATRVTREVTGKEPEIAGITGATDARYFINKSRIPTIYNLGPGRVDQCHVADEYIEIEPLIDAVKVFAKIVLDVCGHA